MSKAIESLSDIFYGLLQQHERMDRIAISKMVKGPASLLALGLGVYLTGRVLWGVIGLAIAWALVLFCIDLRNGALILKGYPQTREKVSKPGKVASLRPLWGSIPLRRLLWLSLPLGFAAMLVSFNSSLPSYFIERYLGEEQLGIFSALIYFLMAGGMVVNALAESAFARLAIYYESGNGEAFRSLLLKLVGIGLLLGVPGILVALVAGRQILTLVYTPKYAEHATLFIWVMVVAAFSYMSAFLMNGMTAVRYFKAQIPLFSLVTVILALSCFWLIPAAGLQGAVMVIFIGVIARSIGSLVIVSHALRQPHVKPVTWAAG